MTVQIPEQTIRDAVAEVFLDEVYGGTSLVARFFDWLRGVWEYIVLRLRPGALPEPVYWLLVVILIFSVIAVLVRFLLTHGLAGGGSGSGDRAHATERSGGDPWALARAHAARGDYTSAAHALYAAVLATLAGQGHVELHESRTIGDYLRHLSRQSSRYFTAFRDFARSYETVIYGLGFCDQDRYERLLGLAGRLVENRG